MCKFCCLSCDDVLIYLWNYLHLCTKLCRITHLSRCDRVRQSLISPTAYKHDEVRIRCDPPGAAGILERLSTIRLPVYLRHIPSLAITFTHLPRKTGPNSQDHSHFFDDISAFRHAANEHSIATATSNRKRQRVAERMIGLASLNQLRTLVLLELQCPNCSSISQSVNQSIDQSIEFPLLPQLEVLIMSGAISDHCLALLISIPSQCPRIRFIDFIGLEIQPNCSLPVPFIDSSSSILLPFVKWLTSVNHAMSQPSFDGDIERCCLVFSQRTIDQSIYQQINQSINRSIEQPINQTIEYVRLCHLNNESFEDWTMSICLSPFRYLSMQQMSSEVDHFAWNNIRVLDLSDLEGALDFDLSMISELPALPSLALLLLPNIDPHSELEDDCEIEGVFNWMNSCPQLTMIDQLTCHPLWTDEVELLIQSNLPARLKSLELLDTPYQLDSILEHESCLDMCFPLSAPFHFLSLTSLAIPLSVTKSGRLTFSLRRLEHLPALHSLLIRLRLTESESEEEDPEEGHVEDESVLSQLSDVKNLRCLAVSFGDYACDEPLDEPFVDLIIAIAIFGCHVPLNKEIENRSSTMLQIESLSLRLAESSVDVVDTVMHGIAYHIDQTTLRDLAISFGSLLLADDNTDQSDVCITPLLLQPLRPFACSHRSKYPFSIIASPLSSSCLEFIDRFHELEPSDAPMISSVEYHSSMMRQLCAADSIRPCWIDDIQMACPSFASSSVKQLSCRQISSSCLLSITNPLSLT